MPRSRGPRDLVIDVAALSRRLGERLPIERQARLSGLSVLETAVAEDAPISVELVLESIQGGVSAVGSIAVDWSASCRRCLRDVTGRLDASVEELFATDHEEGETYPLGHDEVDLEPLVRDAVMLGLPTAPLCSDGCRGPVPDDLPVVLETEASNEAEPPARDPRWAALDVLREEFEAEAENSPAGEGPEGRSD